MERPAEAPTPLAICSLLLFVATPTEEDALREQATKFDLQFQKDAALTKYLRGMGLRDDAWALGTIGAETVVAVGCSRSKGRAVSAWPLGLPEGLVNAALVEVGIRAVDLQQEGERFALALRAGLRKVERRYGDGYLNAVLVDLLDESDLCRNGEIAEVRKYVHANCPDRSGRSYSACREAIASEIGARAVELRDRLKYNPDELRAVMAKALAIYLDERFSVSSRRRFGLLA